MDQNSPRKPSTKNSKVKEISDGVYINLNRITSDPLDFERAIEESFKNLDEKNSSEKDKKTAKK